LPARLPAAMAATVVTAVAVVGGVGAVGYADTLGGDPAHEAQTPADGRLEAVTHTAPGHGSTHDRSESHQVARPGIVLDPTSHRSVHSRPSVSRSAHRSVHRAVRRASRVTHRPHPHPPVIQGPLAANTAQETVADAEGSTWNDPGHCLQWAREQAGIPSGAATAATAWADADVKRRGDTTPPPGAAVYWVGGSHGFGHVAISVGHGLVRSSDAGGLGQVATVPVGWISNHWDLQYAGWSNSINGYTIPGVTPSATSG
jgi:hypothetical protein